MILQKKMNTDLSIILILMMLFSSSCKQKIEKGDIKPRILISTDIGGTDPDDNQSMIHLLMYANMFQIEGLISSPSYGNGNKEEILRTISLYEQDLPKLIAHRDGFPNPEALRALTKQGCKTAAPYKGFTTSTEGSKWIVKCAKKESEQPLWVLVWGGLDDLAQALHDAPDIGDKIKVYWIGGPNKKWSVNSYSYIVENFPDLWFIEVNASYYGFFSKRVAPDSLKNENYYHTFIKEAGYLGKDFKNHYKGHIKMGDTPSLLYVMNGNPNDPTGKSWGGSFESFDYSARTIFNRNTTINDTVTLCSVLEFHFKGPEMIIPSDSACFTMIVQAGIGEQKWDGFYLGNDDYAVKYVPKKSERLSYRITSGILGFTEQDGEFFVDNKWPGKPRSTDYQLGSNWYTDRLEPELYDGDRQGGKTVLSGRNEALLDWGERWKWLQD